MSLRAQLLVAAVGLSAGCGDGSRTGVDLAVTDAGPDSDGGVADLGAGSDAGSCALTANTTPAGVDNGCARLARDTSACRAQRQAAGLSGAWLGFSCAVTLSSGASAVQVSATSEPDYRSNYFATTGGCWEDFTPAFPDPNRIAAQNLVLQIPTSPSSAGQTMGFGAVGVAVNGVAIFDNQAAPGDDIFREAASFDRCQGHPAPGGVYHYHSEPYAISADDASLIGVLRDGYFVYGRRDADGSLPTLDAAGGHTGTTPDSASPVYHYHLNLQTSTAAGTSGQQVWFLTTGRYHGTPGSCTGCGM